jgi:murein L,D-transpeptidase YcbB/YkuD
MRKLGLMAEACLGAALVAFAPSASAATGAYVPANRPVASPPGIASFYATRHGSPLWLRSGADSSAARELIAALKRSPLDGFSAGPALASQAEALLGRAAMGDRGAASDADQLLSAAWVQYVQALQRPPEGMTYADKWVAPRQLGAQQILQQAASARSLAAHVRSVSEVNPIYGQLRDAAWAQLQSTGGTIDPRVQASLDRVRDMPMQDRYIIVDAASARLYMIEDGRIADSMKVIVGRAGPSTQTPMLASTIYYATLNPYWHVTPDLVRSLIAKNVLEQGLGYLESHGYQVLAPDSGADELLDPSTVDWHAVAAGTEKVRVRQLPGPANSMGQLKFGFPNAQDIYLHDTPKKALFASDDRDLSHGCIRLEDAERLGRWLLGRPPRAGGETPEQHALLPTPVPIYLTYLTAQANNGQLTFVDDIYGRDSVEVASIGR